MNWKERARRLKEDLPALWIALRDPQTPWPARLLAGAAVAYALSPVDLIPDFIPVLGCVDDLLLLPALIALAVACIPEPVWRRSREQAAGLWREGRPKRWRYAIPVLLVWGAALGWLALRLAGG